MERSQECDIHLHDRYAEKSQNRRNFRWTAKQDYNTPEKEERMEKLETSIRRQRKTKFDYEQFKEAAVHVATVEIPQIEAEARELIRDEKEEMKKFKRQNRDRKKRRGVDKLSSMVATALQNSESPDNQQPKKKRHNPQHK
jgi:hypothetical protein